LSITRREPAFSGRAKLMIRSSPTLPNASAIACGRLRREAFAPAVGPDDPADFVLLGRGRPVRLAHHADAADEPPRRSVLDREATEPEDAPVVLVALDRGRRVVAAERPEPAGDLGVGVDRGDRLDVSCAPASKDKPRSLDLERGGHQCRDRRGRRPALPAGRPSHIEPCTTQKKGARGGNMVSPTL
jgi:hypothetical protein